jgi:hypothetical protein
MQLIPHKSANTRRPVRRRTRVTRLSPVGEYHIGQLRDSRVSGQYDLDGRRGICAGSYAWNYDL